MCYFSQVILMFYYEFQIATPKSEVSVMRDVWAEDFFSPLRYFCELDTLFLGETSLSWASLQ